MDRAPGWAKSRLLICTLALTQVTALPCFAAKKKDAVDRTVTVKLPAPPKLKQIQGDERILHALDRLTFGPRPGQLEEVKTMGLDPGSRSNSIPQPSTTPRWSNGWNSSRPCV